MNAGRTEQDDDWLIRSMRRYESLYMFELPQPTKCIEWSLDETAICVAGCSDETSTEVTQLALPGKLLPSRDETHWAKRDFTLVNGALSQTAITSLKYLSTTGMLASAGKEPVVTLWKADPVDSDCLIVAGKLELTLPSSVSHSDRAHTLVDAPTSPHTLLTATSSSLRTVQTIDLATRQTVFTAETIADERVHGLAFIPNSENIFVTCSGEKGQLQVWDSRNKPGEQATAQASDSKSVVTSFSFAVSCDSSPGTKLALLSCEGVQLYDMRECREPFALCKLEGGGSSQRGWFGKTITHTPCIKFSDSDSNLVSVSGCTPGVSVYNCAKWTKAERVAVPMFIHSGHEEDSAAAHVIVHSWQPNTPTTILSSDSEGSLHAWQWKDSE